jgi:hypothetical protein
MLPAKARNSSTFAIVVFYALILSAGSFLHHDFACHENSRTHCPSCQMNHAQSAGLEDAPVQVVQQPIGQIELSELLPLSVSALTIESDRAPPA